ncbi:MAG: 5-formyltetrahydrofolate cyclo-ligase [Rhodovarius sp.]|nr:5-formyltetrahydrofolate cyclo-ligase [Rhodovarius sp.]
MSHDSLTGATAHPDGLATAKAALRAAMLARRAELSAAAARSGAESPGEALARHLLAALPPPPGATVAGFWPIRDEIDTRPLLHALARRGHAILLPVTPPRGQPLSFRQWRPGAVLERGRFGTLHPVDASPAPPPEWLLVPLLAFDAQGGRLGYGAGYYDRTLALLPGAVAVGLAYAGQQVPEVPVGPGDKRLAAVATEKGVIRCAPPAHPP